jgi:hypothetical protein
MSQYSWLSDQNLKPGLAEYERLVLGVAPGRLKDHCAA